MGRRKKFIQLVKALYLKLPTIGKKLPTFPHRSMEFEPQTSEVGGECVSTPPPWLIHYRLKADVIVLVRTDH